MRYLSGVIYDPIMRWEHGGVMFTPRMRNTPDLEGVCWAADNGCYTEGDRFNTLRWLAFLAKWQGKGTCLFAVAPDVPFNARATWERSSPHLATIRHMGYPAALAIQNGVNVRELEWNTFDAVFIAGTRGFKTSQAAYEVIREAKRRGLFVHIARRNSYQAVQQAYDMGADSCDGTFLRFGPDKNWPRIQRWFQRFCQHLKVERWASDRRFGRCLNCLRQVRLNEKDGREA